MEEHLPVPGLSYAVDVLCSHGRNDVACATNISA
jgi:hypothetical protein